MEWAIQILLQCLFSYQNSTLHIDNQLAKHCRRVTTKPGLDWRLNQETMSVKQSTVQG